LLIPGESANGRGAEAAGVHPALLPGGRLVRDAAARQKAEAAWQAKLPVEDGLDTRGMLQAAAAGQLEMLILVGANLMQTFPDARLVAEALQKTPFVVVVDLFETETAEFADVVLPAA